LELTDPTDDEPLDDFAIDAKIIRPSHRRQTARRATMSSINLAAEL
jgi:hypothetical protein